MPIKSKRLVTAFGIVCAVACTKQAGPPVGNSASPQRAYLTVQGIHSITEPGYEAFDSTEGIQAALSKSNYLHLPAGTYFIDPAVGIQIRMSGTRIEGAGKYLTILKLKPGPGSAIRRFPTVTTNFVYDVKISNLGVQLNHRNWSAGSEQIGIDFRYFNRGALDNVYVGNCNVSAVGTGQSGLSDEDLLRGYAVAFASKREDPEYKGGELNQIRESHICGARKGVAIDERSLRPLDAEGKPLISSAHNTVVERNLIEHVEVGISQESEWGTGNTYRRNFFQSLRRHPDHRGKGSSASVFAYAMAMDGYAGVIAENSLRRSQVDAAVYFFHSSHNHALRATKVQPGTSLRVVANGKKHRIEAPIEEGFDSPFEASARPNTFPSEAVNVVDFGAHSIKERGFGDFDSTEAIQKAIDVSDKVFIPPGIYRVNLSNVRDGKFRLRGLVLRSNVEIRGAGRMLTYLLPDKTSGSVFRRNFNYTATVPNEEVSNVRISDIGVALDGKFEAPSLRQQQIAFDFRHIGESTLTDIFAGTVNGIIALSSLEERARGYGVVFGSVPNDQANFANGSRNKLIGGRIWGALKAVTLDDSQLSPKSFTHFTEIHSTDIQSAAQSIVQEGKFSHRVKFLDNCVQYPVEDPRFPQVESMFYKLSGVSGVIEGGYMEVLPSTPTKHAVVLEESAEANIVFPSYSNVVRRSPNTVPIENFGTDNRGWYFVHTEKVDDSYVEEMKARE